MPWEAERAALLAALQTRSLRPHAAARRAIGCGRGARRRLGHLGRRGAEDPPVAARALARLERDAVGAARVVEHGLSHVDSAAEGAEADLQED